MTATVTVNNPIGNHADVLVTFSPSPNATIPTTYSVAMGCNQTFAVYPGASLFITEVLWPSPIKNESSNDSIK